MHAAVPLEYVGRKENVESLPDREDRMWQLFEEGRKVFTYLERLEIGQSMLCKFNQEVVDPWKDVTVYHGTRMLSLVQILRGARFN